jgi:hypothetical protein
MTVLFIAVAGGAGAFGALAATVRSALVRRRTRVWLAEIEFARMDAALVELAELGAGPFGRAGWMSSTPDEAPPLRPVAGGPITAPRPGEPRNVRRAVHLAPPR